MYNLIIILFVCFQHAGALPVPDVLYLTLLIYLLCLTSKILFQADLHQQTVFVFAARRVLKLPVYVRKYLWLRRKAN